MKSENKFLKLFRIYRFNSVLFVNFFKMLCVILIIGFAFGSYIYHNAVGVIEKEVVVMNENHDVRMSDLSETAFREIEYIASNIAMDDIVGMYTLDTSDRMIIEQVQDKLRSYTRINRYIDSIYVYSDTDEHICSNDLEYSIDKFEDNEWKSAYEGMNGSDVLLIPRKKADKYPYVLTFIKSTGFLDRPGAIVINVDLKAFGNVIDSYAADSMKFYLIDDSGNIIYSKNDELIQKNISCDETLKTLIEVNKSGIVKVNKKNYAFSKQKSEYYDWNYISVTSLENSREKLINARMIWIIIFFGALLFGTLISVFLALNTLKPFESIVDIIDDNDSHRIIEKMKDNEVKYFAEKIVSVISKNNDLKAELDNRLRLYNEAQLLALQSQINPHFLNNTLNIINMSIVDEAGYKSNSSRMIIQLSKILKSAFEIDKVIVTVAEEVSDAKMYVELLKRRYEDVFSVVWDIDDNVENNKILKMLLQPLIENSVYHGIIGAGIESGIISIAIRNEGGETFVSVSDTGGGMDEETRCSLIESMRDENLSSKHIGMKNVYMRLKIVFGDNVDFGINSKIGNGTEVWFRIY